MNKTLYFRFLLAFVAIGFAQASFAQRADESPKMERLSAKDLPKLERVVINGVEKSTSPIKEEDKLPFIKDSEALNLSEADGKISRQEMRIIEHARKLPQTE